MRPSLIADNSYYWAYPRYGRRGMWHIRKNRHSTLGVLCGVYSKRLVWRSGDESKPYCRKCYKFYLVELMA